MNQLSTIDIRLATLEDLDDLVPLFDAYRQFYAKPSDLPAARAFLLERLQHDQSVILLARDRGGVPVGFTQLYPSFSSVSLAKIYVLNDLYVMPGARRSGVAVRLLRAAAEHGGETGALRLVLSTGVENRGAQTLYEGEGWQRDYAFLTYELPLKG